jgi:hypothetical protein
VARLAPFERVALVVGFETDAGDRNSSPSSEAL